ncbi:MAG: pyruvate formate-lyase [Clostridia bacterium]|nr:pyruvate formate-lyase [Clostridia bacterium]
MTSVQLLHYATEFTQRYRGADNKYEREADCLQWQLRHSLLPMGTEDLVAGRHRRLPLGILPQEFWGMGYYIDEDAFFALTTDECLTVDQRRQAAGLLDFWRCENTRSKIVAAYPTEWTDEFACQAPYDTPTNGFLLHRISGIQMDPTRLLQQGVDGLLTLAQEKMNNNPAFYAGVRQALLVLREVCLRYAEEAEADGRADLAVDLRHIAYEPATSFRQALQLSYLFMVASGTWNYGRMDKYLGAYLHRDLTAGTLTEEAALALILDLWRRIEERNDYFDSRVILGGCDRPEGADTFARLAMEATRRRRGVVPQLTLRCYAGMDRRLYDMALDIIGEGVTFPMLYNDEVNIPAVMDAFGVDSDTAQDYVPFGCGEYVLCNKSIGTPSGTLHTLHILNEMMYGERAEAFLTAPDFETFYARYLERIRCLARYQAAHEKLEYDVCGQECAFLFFSIAFDDCLERGLGVLEGGLRHLGGTLEVYGNINAADSLTAIRQMVYEQHTISSTQLSAVLKSDFAEQDTLRRQMLEQPKYGNDHPVADEMLTRLHRDVCNAVRDAAPEVGLDSYLVVVINNELNAVFGTATGASADGRRAGQYMANGNNPMSGADQKGVTAMLNSLVKPDTHIHAGAVQNMRFSREMFTTLRPKLEGLLGTYFRQGGAQSMITVLGRGDLEAALREPEKYRNLVVRVGGFSARFVDLQPAVQQELLCRTLY